MGGFSRLSELLLGFVNPPLVGKPPPTLAEDDLSGDPRQNFSCEVDTDFSEPPVKELDLGGDMFNLSGDVGNPLNGVGEAALNECRGDEMIDLIGEVPTDLSGETPRDFIGDVATDLSGDG